MQVIDKPKQYNLPIKLSPHIGNEKSQSKLPNIYLGHKNMKYSKMKSTKDFTIRYSQLQHSRGEIRTALSKNMNFEHIQGCEHSFLPQKLLQDLPETVKPLGYKSEQYQVVLKIVKGIFGDDFSLSSRDILVAKGKVSATFYIFFTSAYYRPQSFCCSVMIYLKLQKSPDNPDDLYNVHPDNISPFSAYSTTFVCANCKKAVLKLKQQNIFKKNRSTDKLNNRTFEQDYFQKQRKKIMMSIMVASGRYKKSLINDLSALRSPKQTLNMSQNSTIPLKAKSSPRNKKMFDI